MAPNELCRRMSVSFAIMADPRRKDMVDKLLEQLGDVPVAWENGNGIWDTRKRASMMYDPRATHHVVIQDDAILCTNFVEKVEQLSAQYPNKSLGLFFGTLGGPLELAKRKEQFGGFVCHDYYWGVAIGLPVKIINRMFAWCEGVKGLDNNDDSRMGKWAKQFKHSVYYPLPSLVDHPSDNSIINGKPNRVAWKFIGKKMENMKTAVLTRFHYANDNPDFEWRFNYWRDNSLPRLLAQTNQDFEIWIWCEEHHRSLFESLNSKIHTFTATYPTVESKYFIDFTPYSNTKGLPKFEVQIGLDSDELVEPNFIEEIHKYCYGDKKKHIGFQGVLLDIDTGKKYHMTQTYGKDRGSAIFAFYQPDIENNYHFILSDSHLKQPQYAEEVIIIKEGYVWVSIHGKNDSTTITKNHRQYYRPGSNTVKVFFLESENNNCGDILTKPILEHFGYNVEYVGRNTTGKLLGVGSILSALKQNDIVWGSGNIGVRQIMAPKGVKFLAVRGPMTKVTVKKAVIPPIYGDPALLLPLVYNPDIEQIHEVGYIPHYVDAGLQPDDGLYINIRDDWQEIVKNIKSCKKIVSSSLHGIILAEAYGIPAVWAVYSDKIIGGEFKFQDYFMGTGRDRQRPDTILPPIKNLDEIQNRLIKSLDYLNR